jgi:hypothetical protein
MCGWKNIAEMSNELVRRRLIGFELLVRGGQHRSRKTSARGSRASDGRSLSSAAPF